MAKVIAKKAPSRMDEHLHALRGNSHFHGFLDELKIQCKHGDTVFDVDNRKTAFLQGRQDVCNFLIKKLDALSKPAE